MSLKRELSLFGAVMMGLGSIIGTGVFVSISIAADITGPSVILAIVLAACVACCNALSTAQLAAHHAVSGGTYEYGYRYLNPTLGFVAGWMFLCAKSASAATAALGFSGYLLYSITGAVSRTYLVGIAAVTVCVLTGVVLAGIRRSHYVNTVIVVLTLCALLSFVIGGTSLAFQHGTTYLFPFFKAQQGSPFYHLLEATALMFVAYTGYGRIATLGEEVKDPYRTIPKAISVTLTVSALVYISVGLISILSVDPSVLSEITTGHVAALEVISRQFSFPYVHWIVSIGATMAMLGVLLNLILGLSRTLFAMGRRGDMPAVVTRLTLSQTTPYISVLSVGSIILGLTLLGNIKTAWSFSAFTVLIYYSITNLAALQLSKEERLYPRILVWFGLVSCLFLAFWVEKTIWMIGIGLICVGVMWHKLQQKVRKSC